MRSFFICLILCLPLLAGEHDKNKSVTVVKTTTVEKTVIVNNHDCDRGEKRGHRWHHHRHHNPRYDEQQVVVVEEQQPKVIYIEQTPPPPPPPRKPGLRINVEATIPVK